ncbi:DegT/DnrJ/EryC1/StrS family aminotransferase [Halobacterium jilantaiense]|uniref:dTDP-4-amino-4,6-dideoxygalactose transaminase n=1 Tax=Halobacterium jilantaiense TaxID=355548 RepID=A0A1I0MUQ9_9EURY|nr:DegT/DnrJ/EryC1/StrS family aminotransferase [Halobacterium jilantaiense]SEV91735.1 dTDP-4-amino-4,6-dideoxygalactose transaminase [Halobacterium jilantaiense]
MSDIPLFEIPWDENDISNVVESVSRGSYWAKGPYVDEFESKLAEYFDVEHALVVNSGTTALECLLRAYDIGEGDEVLVPSFTFIATANVVELLGAEPVFVDIERETLGMDPKDARKKLTDDTAMILPIHCYGSACLVEDLTDLANEAGVPLVEDAAEAFGAIAGGQKVGTFGDAAALSFCQNKILPTGEGGAILTEDDTIARRVAQYRSHGREPNSNYFQSADSGQYTTTGSNYRMPDVVAALGCSQFEKVGELVDSRREVAETYNNSLGELDGVVPVRGRNSGSNQHVFQLYSVLFDNESVRTSVVDELERRGIACKIYWDPPVHQTEVYKNGEHPALPTTEDVSSRVLSLPMYAGLPERQILRVVDGVEAAVKTA